MSMNKLKKRFEPYRQTFFLMLILLVNIGFVFAAIHLFPFGYEENDDVIMCLIASGAYFDAPDAHLVFINFFFGKFLVFLYTLFSDFEWYTFIFVLIHVLSLTVIVCEIWKSERSKIIKLLYTALLYAIEIRLLLWFQFTTTAALCAFAGFTLIFQKQTWKLFLGCCLVVIASLIRFDAAMLVILLTIPFFVCINRFLERKIKTISFFIGLFFLIFTFKLLDSKIYSKDKEWKAYKEYNILRSKINDNPDAKKIEKLPDDISKEDYLLYQRFFPDPLFFDYQKTECLTNLIDAVSLETKIKNFLNTFLKYLPQISILFAVIGICFFDCKTKRLKVFLICYSLLFMMLFCYISMNSFLKYRVFITMFLPAISTGFVFYEKTSKKHKKMFIYVICICISLWSVENTIIGIKKHNKMNKIFEQQQSLFEMTHKKELTMIPFEGNFKIEYFDAFKLSKTFNQRLLIQGWLTNIPLNKNRFNSYKQLLDKNMVLFVTERSRKEIMPLIQKVLSDRYGVETDIVILETKDEFSVIQFEKKEF